MTKCHGLDHGDRRLVDATCNGNSSPHYRDISQIDNPGVMSHTVQNIY